MNDKLLAQTTKNSEVLEGRWFVLFSRNGNVSYGKKVSATYQSSHLGGM